MIRTFCDLNLVLYLDLSLLISLQLVPLFVPLKQNYNEDVISLVSLSKRQ